MLVIDALDRGMGTERKPIADTPFAERLTAAIDSQGSNQSKLARASGIAQPAISAMAAGRQRPYFDQSAVIAAALDVSLDWLAGFTDHEKRVEAPALTEDESRILWLVRSSGLTADDVARALVGVKASANQVARTIPSLDPVTGEELPPTTRRGQARKSS